jgi:transposase
MLRAKTRAFAPLCNLTVEDLVPADHFYRHLEASLDLAFVRPWVKALYAERGRPAVDPVVFFKLQLVMFFEGIRSERQLMRVAADRLSLRWYLGYDLAEALPDHSSLTRIRKRYGLAVFRRFFEAIVEQYREAGLIWGKELYFDATQVKANASLESIAPRFAVEAHLGELFTEDLAEASSPDEGESQPIELPLSITEVEREQLGHANEERHDWLARDGAPDRTIVRGGYRRRSDFEASTTDPDAALMALKKGGLHFGYHDHYAVDGGKARIILEVLVTPADVMENQPFLDLLWRACFRWQIRPDQVTGDATCGSVAAIVAIEEQGIHAYVPLSDVGKRPGFFGPEAFTYDAQQDVYTCPNGTVLRFRGNHYAARARAYQAPASACGACPLKARCTDSLKGRIFTRSFDEAYLDRVRGYHETDAYRKAMRKRSVWVEPLFGEAKDWHGLQRFRLRRLWKVNAEALLIATGQNLKRLLRRRGWGRRPWPNGTPEAPLARQFLAKLLRWSLSLA